MMHIALTAPVGASKNMLAELEQIKKTRQVPQMRRFSFEPYAVGYTMDWILFNEEYP
jgi:hypothetical protein